MIHISYIFNKNRNLVATSQRRVVDPARVPMCCFPCLFTFTVALQRVNTPVDTAATHWHASSCHRPHLFHTAITSLKPHIIPQQIKCGHIFFCLSSLSTSQFRHTGRCYAARGSAPPLEFRALAIQVGRREHGVQMTVVGSKLYQTLQHPVNMRNHRICLHHVLRRSTPSTSLHRCVAFTDPTQQSSCYLLYMPPFSTSSPGSLSPTTSVLRPPPV